TRRRTREVGMAGEIARRSGLKNTCTRAILGAAMICGTSAAQAADVAAVIETYADIAHAKYEDALNAAMALEQAVDTLIAQPTEDNLKAARLAWLASRPSYQETEGYRFGNSIVDDWEGRVNAWPLD